MKTKPFTRTPGTWRGQVATQTTARKSESRLRRPVRREVAGGGSFPGTLAALYSLSVTALWLSAPATFAADETCASCGQEVSVSGEFAHSKYDASLAIEGADNNVAAFHEEIYGENFTVTIAHLPAGKYTVSIGEAETWASAPGERIFSVTSGDTTLAKDFDIIAAAGGARKVCYITGVVEHEDDSIKGPLTVSFSTSKDNAKFNTFEVKNASGAPVVSFSASEMADAFSADGGTHIRKSATRRSGVTRRSRCRPA